jgi:hypothetical protein
MFKNTIFKVSKEIKVIIYSNSVHCSSIQGYLRAETTPFWSIKEQHEATMTKKQASETTQRKLRVRECN